MLHIIYYVINWKANILSFWQNWTKAGGNLTPKLQLSSFYISWNVYAFGYVCRVSEKYRIMGYSTVPCEITADRQVVHSRGKTG